MSCAYANSSTTIREPKAAIRSIIDEIEQQTFEKITKSSLKEIERANIKSGVPIRPPYTNGL